VLRRVSSRIKLQHSVDIFAVGAGQRTGILVISDDAANSPQSVQLTGMGAARRRDAVVKLTPNNISFGMVTQGATAVGK